MLLCRKSCEKFLLDISGIYVIIRGSLRDAYSHGGIAQLGERLNGIQEVSGSIPLISTKSLQELEKP